MKGDRTREQFIEREYASHFNWGPNTFKKIIEVHRKKTRKWYMQL